VISVASGRVLRFLSPPPGSQALGVLSADRKTSTRLAYQLVHWGPPAYTAELHVVEVARMRSITDGVVLRAPDPSCELAHPQFLASGRLLVVDQCEAVTDSTAPASGRHGASLVEYDPATGRFAGTVVRLRASSAVNSLSVDASGQHVLVLDFPSSSNPKVMRASVRWRRLRDYGAPEAWVRRVAFNLAADQRRRGLRRARALLRLTSPPPVAALDAVPVEVDLARALARLPLRHRSLRVTTADRSATGGRGVRKGP